MKRNYRIAFLAPAYVTEPNAGGMASYLSRMASALLAAGHAPEIFVLSSERTGRGLHHGIPLHFVPPTRSFGHLKWLRYAAKLPLGRAFRGDIQILSGAAQLAHAFDRRHAEHPFDLVQTSDYCATGWFLKPRPRLTHVVRCSVARELLSAVDQGDSQSMQRAWTHYEIESVRRAEIVYAPSKFVADYYARKLQKDIPVVRPPLHFEKSLNVEAPAGIPERFLLHFGQMRSYKGTPWLLDALPHAWKLAPDMQVLLIGPVRDSRLRKRLAALVAADNRVMHVDTLARPQMYVVLRRALAAVLPSLADNLPNTVIEALSMGIPVIGSDGSSIDELMIHGRHGELVPMENTVALAEAMARAWLGESTSPGFIWDAPIVEQMDPLESIRALGTLVNLDLAPKPVEAETLRTHAIV